MSESFNYIAFGSRDYLEENYKDFSMSRGRMFEYTPTEIAKRLESLSDTSISFLKGLPTFLCSEIRLTGKSCSMLMRYGKLEKITFDKAEVSAAFDTIIDFGEVEFSDVEQARQVLDADKFELYRTHWAVREGSATAVLNRLVELHPRFLGQVDRELSATNRGGTQSGPPPRPKEYLGWADSVESFLQCFNERAETRSAETFYRGHHDYDFELTPTLLRKSSKGAWLHMPYEDRLCKELLISHYDEFQSDHYCFDRLVRMRHYGLPTRLLDITSNPLIALFFACHCDEEVEEKYGEVIIFEISPARVKYYDSDTVSCISNLANLSHEQKNALELNLSFEKFNEHEVTKKLLHYIKSEKGYFEGKILPSDLGSIVCVKAKRTNTRIKSQSGAFLLFGHDAVLPEGGSDEIALTRIEIRDKKKILEQLDRLNINVTTVYPSADQTAVHLSRKYTQTS